MIFSQIKQLSIVSVLTEINQISNSIKELAVETSGNPQMKEYFEQVQLDQEEIAKNLQMHSQIIRSIGLKLAESQNRINLKTVDQLLCFLGQWFNDYKEQQGQYKAIEKVIKVLQIQGKLKCLEQFMTPALTYTDDIAAFPLESSPKYSKVYEKIEVIQSSQAEETREDYKTFKKLIAITNAAVLTELSQSNSFFGVMSFGLSYPRFWIDFNEAQLRNNAFLRKPQLQKLLQIWNLPEKGAMSGLKYVQYPSIDTNRLIYIPLDQKDYDSADILTPSQRSVAVRVLSNRPVTFWQEQIKGCCSCGFKAKVSSFDKVIIHAHGGGFVALSSSTMQNYTRLWSKELDVPVLSIDYRKPPKYTFPDPVYDVFAVYKFISSLEIFKHTNLRPTTIILAGDSAGANLVLSAAALAMKIRLPHPKAFFLAYPASDLRSIYTPSRISSFTDAILHPSLLLLCLKEYLGTNQKQVQNHPLASPILISEAFVRGNPSDNRWPLKWPPTRIMVGELDPLLDDSIRLCQRMLGSGVDVRCRIYKELGHGFLSVQNIVKQGQIGISDSIIILRELFSSTV